MQECDPSRCAWHISQAMQTLPSEHFSVSPKHAFQDLLVRWEALPQATCKQHETCFKCLEGTPDMHMSWRLYLPAFLAGNLTSTSCASTSASFATLGPPWAVLLTTAALLLLVCSCPSSILVMRAPVLGLDRSNAGEASALPQRITYQELEYCHNFPLCFCLQTMH